MGWLSGVRVLELGVMLSAPFASRMLGDFGATVIKVEPLEGDQMRSIGPLRNSGMGAIFLNNNRNKTSICVDLRSQSGLEVLRRLISGSDVLVGNVRPASLERLGVTEEYLDNANPDLISVFINGFSSDGIYSGRPAYDDLVQAKCGIPKIGKRSANQYIPSAIADRIAGYNCALAAVSMLSAKRGGAEGRLSQEIGMFEAVTDFVMSDHLGGATFVPRQGDIGFHRYAEVRRIFPTLDGEIALMLHTDRHWQAFLAEMGDEELSAGPPFNSIEVRARNLTEIYGYVEDVIKTRSTQDWLSFFERHDIPAERVNSLEDVLEDPHLAAIGFFQEVDHDTEGRLRSARHSIRNRTGSTRRPWVGIRQPC